MQATWRIVAQSYLDQLSFQDRTCIQDAVRSAAENWDRLDPIPAVEYADLLDCRRRLAEADFRRKQLMNPLRSRIDRDAEVGVIPAERFGWMTLMDALAECRAQFGDDRTPSRSSAHRYLQRLRKVQRSRRR